MYFEDPDAPYLRLGIATLGCLEKKVQTYSSNSRSNGDLPWYQVNNRLKPKIQEFLPRFFDAQNLRPRPGSYSPSTQTIRGYKKSDANDGETHGEFVHDAKDHTPWGSFVCAIFLGDTLPETNISPENRPLEKEIPIENHHFQRLCWF